LVDEAQLWVTGRTVQCDACGQRWRAAGKGVRPAPLARPEPDSAPDARPEPAPESAARPGPQPEPEPIIEVIMEAPAAARAETVLEPVADAAPAPDAYGRTGPLILKFPSLSPDAPLTIEETLSPPALFKAPPPRRRSTYGSGSPRLGLWLALICLLIILVTAAVMFRGALIESFPGLAPLYTSVGLRMTVASPHV
jgi:hypothetical protein